MENIDLAKIERLVSEILSNDNSGHDMEHIKNVMALSLKFAKEEKCNKSLVVAIALLHDVDDYKLFGIKNQNQQTNAHNILSQIEINNTSKNLILNEISKIGYSKYLKGCRPSSIEGQIVSDADMCESIGANGILRTLKYCSKHDKPFFNRDAWPLEDINPTTYNRPCSESVVCHLFEKILRLKYIMLTQPGKMEAKIRHDFVVNFLRQYFIEVNTPEWDDYLSQFIKKEENENDVVDNTVKC